MTDGLLEPTELGFVGLGNIGGGICANLVADGHELSIFDVDPSRMEPLVAAGAHAASSPSDVAEKATWTFLSLPSPQAMGLVASQWLEKARGSGKILVDLSTNSPTTIRSIGAELENAGAHLVEAPVTGGAPGARNRTLVFITGGDEVTVGAVAPLLNTIGRAVFYMGPLGCGNTAKLVNSLMALSSMWTSLEGLALAEKNGIDLRSLVELVRSSGGANSYLDRRVEEINERGRPAQFSLELAAKDAGLIVGAGAEADVPMPVASALHQMLVFAKAQGLGPHDISDMVEAMERAASVDLRLRQPETPPAES